MITQTGTESELIYRQQAIDAIDKALSRTFTALCGGMILKDVPSAEPNTDLQNLAEEIAQFKRCVKSENSDYLTGYLCALSAVEGMIAERITDKWFCGYGE